MERFEPRDVDELAATLAEANAKSHPLRVVGGGTRMGVSASSASEPSAATLSCQGLAGVREIDAAEGVALVGAGTRIAALAAEVAEAGWHLPLEGVGPESSVGGALSSASLGMRALHDGAPRDHVLGMRIVDGRGQISKCGGRVVKNVTGYDLAKLYVGSHGALGVIESVWLHLRPRPRARRTSARSISSDAFAIGLEAARRPAASAVLLASPGAVGVEAVDGTEGWRLFVELAGDDAVCDADADWLARTASKGAGADSAEGARIERALAEQVCVRPAPDRLSVRVHVLPTRLKSLCADLVAGGAAVVAAPAPGFAVATWRGGEANAAALRASEEAARRHEGTGFLLSVPAGIAMTDSFGLEPGVVALMAALKSRFDPAGILPAALPAAVGHG